MTRFCTVAVLVFAALLAAPGVPAQPPSCLGDDGFNTGCCQTPVPNLPNLPSMTLQAVYACINNCQPGNPHNVVVTVGSPQVFLCDYALVPVSVNFAGGLSFGGALLAKYARTWTEPTASGLIRQVWRFLVNGDFPWTGAVPSLTCPVPPCALSTNEVPTHWDGHLDYACELPGPIGFSVIVSLSHMPGCLSHAPFSAYPLPPAAAHNNSSYHLVGPAPFAFLPILEPQGPVIAESVRTSFLNWSPFVYQCKSEAQVVQGALQTQTTNCICSPILPIVGPWKHQNLNGQVCCNGAFFPLASIPLPGTPLFTGFAAQTLGAFGGPAGGFPGNRELTLYVGLLHYPDPCNPITPTIPIHAVTGVGTARHPGQLFPGGVTTCPVGSPPFATTFIDLQNMLLLAAATAAAPPLPGIGGLFASTAVFSLNLP